MTKSINLQVPGFPDTDIVFIYITYFYVWIYTLSVYQQLKKDILKIRNWPAVKWLEKREAPTEKEGATGDTFNLNAWPIVRLEAERMIIVEAILTYDALVVGCYYVSFCIELYEGHKVFDLYLVRTTGFSLASLM